MSEQWPGPMPPENRGQPYVRNVGVPGHVPEHQPGTGPGDQWSQGGQRPWSQGGQRPAAASAAVDPGWRARIVFWVSILIDRLPAIIMLPFLYSTSIADGLPDLAAIYSVVVLIAGIIACLVGVLAFLLVRNTSWVRRMIGGGIYLVAVILGMTVPPVLSRLITEYVYRMNMDYSLFSFVFAAFSMVVTAALLIAWNIVRNRSWWVHLVAVGLAVVSAFVVAVTQYVITLQAPAFGVAAIVPQVLSLLLFFAALGLLHVCGRLRGGSVPVVAQPALGERRRLQPGPAAGGQYSGAQFAGTQYPGAQSWGDQFSGGQHSGGQHPGAPNYGGQPPGAPNYGGQHSGALYAGAPNQGAQYPYDAQYSGAHEAYGSRQTSGPNSAGQPYADGRHYDNRWNDGQHGAGDPPRRPRH
ncbi:MULTISPECIES: ABC transporter permease [Brevibacterium]|uniref:ABC transporter permease n=1 Tax=Brevibacterium TaxID=1696 RepID=UPI001BAD0AB3|nr:ABC transporter permease [Brevibacterium sp. W7.2]